MFEIIFENVINDVINDNKTGKILEFLRNYQKSKYFEQNRRPTSAAFLLI